MKKRVLALLPLTLAACSTPTQQSSVPMDMKAVAEYQQKVASGKTVDPKAKLDDSELNQSDRRQKVIYHHYERVPVIVPHIGYHRGWGNVYSGGRMGIGLGGFY